jgi:hypothetical protein
MQQSFIVTNKKELQNKDQEKNISMALKLG